MTFPAKVEIIGIRYKEYDYNELMKGIAGIYRYHRPVMIVDSKTVLEGVGAERQRNVYQYYLCRRRWFGVVLINICITYILNRIFANSKKNDEAN